MIFSSIICLDDLLHKNCWQSKNFFYDLMREPIRQATGGYNIKSSPRNNADHNLIPGFNLQQFLGLAKSGTAPFWHKLFCHIPQAAQEYLIEYLPDNSLVLSYEMPPWLREVLTKKRTSYIDIRLSPLRFGSDLYIALRTNHAGIRAGITQYQIDDEEFLLEANMLAAAVRLTKQGQNKAAESLEDTIVYIGQTENDTSLVDEQGNFIRLDSFSQTLVKATKGRRILYAPHPYGKAFGLQEQLLLSKTLSIHVDACSNDLYEMFGAEEAIQFIGISSGSLQEAKWFNKSAIMLYHPICPVVKSEGKEVYLQVHFTDFISPGFWHSLCAPDMTAPVVSNVSFIGQNTLRHLHNLWWGYSAYLLKRSRFFKEAFVLSGGWKLHNELQELKNTVATLERKQAILEKRLQ